MKILNFYPFYEEYLKSYVKTTTLRLTNAANYKQDEEVIISIGWDEEDAIHLHTARIKKIYRRRICELKKIDFRGESPDCKSQETARLVLSCIYRTLLKNDDRIWVIKFEHIKKH